MSDRDFARSRIIGPRFQISAALDEQFERFGAIEQHAVGNHSPVVLFERTTSNTFRD